MGMNAIEESCGRDDRCEEGIYVAKKIDVLMK